MKATEWHFSVVLFIMPYKVVQTKPWNRDLQYDLTKVVARDLT